MMPFRNSVNGTILCCQFTSIKYCRIKIGPNISLPCPNDTADVYNIVMSPSIYLDDYNLPVG
jgi:hypothetical protein